MYHVSCHIKEAYHSYPMGVALPGTKQKDTAKIDQAYVTVTLCERHHHEEPMIQKLLPY